MGTPVICECIKPTAFDTLFITTIELFLFVGVCAATVFIQTALQKIARLQEEEPPYTPDEYRKDLELFFSIYRGEEATEEDKLMLRQVRERINRKLAYGIYDEGENDATDTHGRNGDLLERQQHRFPSEGGKAGAFKYQWQGNEN
jgi:hypothetical protein